MSRNFLRASESTDWLVGLLLLLLLLYGIAALAIVIATYCYTHGEPWSVCLCVCLLVTFVSPAKTAETIEMPFEWLTRMAKEHTYMHAYIQIYIAPTSWKRIRIAGAGWLDSKSRLEEMWLKLTLERWKSVYRAYMLRNHKLDGVKVGPIH